MAERYPTNSQIKGLPDYDKFQTSTIATGKEGIAPGELFSPRGVARCRRTGQTMGYSYTWG